jgi:branched-chain amino acid transport system permease protein
VIDRDDLPHQLNEALGPELTFMGATINTQGVDSWVRHVFLLITGGVCSS